MRFLATLVAIVLLVPICAAAQSDGVQHVVVFKEEGRFGGWPANNGIWSWGDEVVVGFTHGYHKINPKGGHDVDRDRPSSRKQARSLDGGESWTLEDGPVSGASTTGLSEPVDFSNPDCAVRFRSSEFLVSTDRAQTWQGPYALPLYGRPRLLCRTDYLIEGPQRLTAFIAAAKDSGQEGQPLCIRTEDGGLTWDLVGWVGDQPPQDYGYAIMPATVRVGETGYLSMIRRGGVYDGKKSWWIEPYLSPDDGKSWYLLDEPRIENSGNPATLTRLENGDLALTYGWRRSPYGIRARISTDDGQSWGREYSLRSDSRSWDIGYPRTVQRPDGKCVTAYYYHPPGEDLRSIEATIWDPEMFRR